MNPAKARRAALFWFFLSIGLAACTGESPESLLASAKEYLDKDDPKAAVIQIKNALQENPDYAEARFLLGKTLLGTGEPVAAEVELRKALALGHPAEQTVPELARALLFQGQAKKAIDELGALKDLTPAGVAEVQTALAAAYGKMGKAAEAESALKRALAAQPDHVPAMVSKARLDATRGDIARALSAADAILAKVPNNADAHFLRGDLLFAQRKIGPATEAYRAAIKAKPDHIPAYSALLNMLFAENKLEEATAASEQLKKIAPRNLLSTFMEARLAFVKKDYAKARELMQQYLKRVPNDPAGLQLAGSIEYAAQSFSQAELHFSKQVREAPDNLIARRMLALTHLRLGQPARALQALNPVLGKFESNPQMLSLAGEVLMRNGDVARAERYFKKAAALDPKNVGTKTSLAVTKLAKGKQSGFAALEQIAAADTGTHADMVLIASSMRLRQYDKALKAIDGLQKKEPDAPLPHHLRAGALLAKKDITGARKSFERALSVMPSYFPSAAGLARLDMAEKKPDQAAKRFESVLAADPKSFQSILAMAEIKALAAAPQDEMLALYTNAVSVAPTEIAPRVALVEFHLRARNGREAVAAAQDAEAAISNQPEIIDALGRAQLASGDANQAIVTFGRIVTMRPNSPVPHLRLAEAHQVARNRTAAIQSLQKALDVQPRLLEAQTALAGLHLAGGALDQALRIAQDVQKQRPKDAVGWLIEGDVRAARKSWKEAVAAYGRALKLSPAPYIAIKLHAVIETSKGTTEAQRFATGWVKDHPQDMAFRFHLGDRALARKDLDGAAAQYRSIVDAKPDNALALNNLAWVSAQQKNPEALEYAEKANKLAPGNPGFMDTLAMILIDKGDHGRAIDLLKKAGSLAPNMPVIHLNLARALARSGDKAGALKELDALAQTADTGPIKEEIERLRREL
jgi:cellulose synthase operon protein C